MLITTAHLQDRSLLLKEITKLALGRLPADNSESYQSFIHALIERFPLRDWIGRNLDDFYAATLGFHSFALHYSGSETLVRVFNPDRDTDAWACERSVVLVHCLDRPFLVDSIRIVLKNLECQVQVAKSTVFEVQRTASGKMQRAVLFAPQDKSAQTTASNSSREALIYFELSALATDEDRQTLAAALKQVLEEVEHVVDDYSSMIEYLGEGIAQLQRHRADQDEAIAFLSWLKESHFTFLGFQEFSLANQRNDGSGPVALRENVSARLGIFGLQGASENASAEGSREFYAGEEVICFSKSSSRSTVHRDVYPDYVVLKRYREDGKVSGELRFLGFYTYAVSSLAPAQIPILRRKIAYVIEKSGLDPRSHDGKRLVRTIDLHPKEELFQTPVDKLYEDLLAITDLNERNVVRLIVRADQFGHFVVALAYVPRELFNTDVKNKIQDLIGKKIGANQCDATAFFSESRHARLQLVFRLENKLSVGIEVDQIENEISQLVMGWHEHLAQALVKSVGEISGTRLLKKYQRAFTQSYQEQNGAGVAVRDIEAIEALGSAAEISMYLYRHASDEKDRLRFRLLHLDSMLELSEVIPVLEQMGLRVLGDQPHELRWEKQGSAWVHDFLLHYHAQGELDLDRVRDKFQRAFQAAWKKQCENDSFNRLVLSAGLEWREVMLLRAYANYMKQTLFHLSLDYIAETLNHYPGIAAALMEVFKISFDPALKLKTEERERRAGDLSAKIEKNLDEIKNLNQDQVFRRYLEMLRSTLRSNFYQRTREGIFKPCISLKMNPRNISEIPEPKPEFEIFVFSPRVEGVHLRTAKVARGGLRWSDRLEDYRTEVLGLVKAQQVKNAVIVPSGAKGGFVAKRLPVGATRGVMLAEGIECYKIFVSALLDVTDNVVNGDLVHPYEVVCKDEFDPYLVVAADKGTATFSDIANEISRDYGHWLGDAFASGGGNGYDHKKMGITARGAWESVQAHFRLLGKDIQREDFSVVGIGDMAGDVFGNGMLLSQHICLLAAFNHLHIFVDPNPDSAASFEERKRLFNLAGSSWTDYNTSLISAGGGIFERSAKYIDISAPMQERFGISESRLRPTELIKCILKAEFELLWNGGIGTYVKSKQETHADVGDKANDNLRINGSELRCKVVGEGGNLGMTQRGRIEYSLAGGACNTDFIDNAGGVDCSDHEVNIKILLDQLVQSKQLTSKARSTLLAEMTDDVAKLVLESNYAQAFILGITQYQIGKRTQEFARFIDQLESSGRLKRQLEFIPSNDEIAERVAKGQSFTRPELAILLSYAKVELKSRFLQLDFDGAHYLNAYLAKAFPARLNDKYAAEIQRHKLRPEIIATQLANDIVNRLGITSFQRIQDSTGADTLELVKAYVVVSELFHLPEFSSYLVTLDNVLPAAMQYNLMVNLNRRARRAARWLVKNRRAGVVPEREIETFADALKTLRENVANLLSGDEKDRFEERAMRLRKIGIDERWVNILVMPENLFSGLGIIDVAQQSNAKIRAAAHMFGALIDLLQLEWFATKLSDMNVDSYWQAFARESFLDDLEAQVRKLSALLLQRGLGRPVDELLETWEKRFQYLVNRWIDMMKQVDSTRPSDYAMYSVALRELIDLVQATAQWEVVEGG